MTRVAALSHPPHGNVVEIRPWRTQPFVSRARLVRRLSAAGTASLAALVAPSGYGKTTLLREWVEADPRPHAWLTLTAALDKRSGLRQAIAALLPAEPFVLVLDDFDVLTDRAAVAVVTDLVEQLEPGSIVAVASRAEPALPIGRLRAGDRVLELRREDLRMTAHESELLVRRAGLRLAAPDLETLFARTEGWPVGLQLAAMALRDEPHPRAALRRFGGADRVIADYLDAQLAQLTPSRRKFLVRTSPLEVLTGELCDAVLGATGSGRVLRELERGDVLLEALDRNEERFRHHPLLADALRAELRRTDPAFTAEVHRRASIWFEQEGELEFAVEHAVSAGELDRAGEIVWDALPEWWAQGAGRRIEAWLDRVGDRELATHPALAGVAAAVELRAGRRASASRWIEAAEPAGAPRNALLRAAEGPPTVGEMAAQAERAYDRDRAGSTWRPVARLLSGVAHALAGDGLTARAHLEHGARLAAGTLPVVQALCDAQLALLELAEEDFADGAELAAAAQADLEGVELEGSPVAGLVHATAAFAHAHAGDAERAREQVALGSHAIAQPDGLPPWYVAEVRFALARAELRLSDAAAARALLGEASRAMRRLPDATVLRDWIDDAWARADTFAAEAVSGHWTLTTAELRVLRFLPSHLSFREIASRLHVSANTIKTQAHAVYRKLDVSSRSDAVAKARSIGLVDG